MAAARRAGGKIPSQCLTYYYHGADGNAYEQPQSGFIVGHSLLTANSVPCAGEGDLKTNLAMKICVFSGLAAASLRLSHGFIDGTILLGDGPSTWRSPRRAKPILRGMGVYHGKRGSSISRGGQGEERACYHAGGYSDGGRAPEADYQRGRVYQRTMQIGNTQTPVKFSVDPDTYFERWFEVRRTHHCAMSIGHNAALMKKVAELMNLGM